MSKIKIEEVCCMIDSSIQTVNNWYKWKRDNPENELASLLPDYTQNGPRQTRYWEREDVWKFLEFKKSIIHGRNGVMGDVTQRRKKGGKINGKKTTKGTNHE